MVWFQTRAHCMRGDVFDTSTTSSPQRHREKRVLYKSCHLERSEAQPNGVERPCVPWRSPPKSRCFRWANYFNVTPVTLISGYSWFHCIEIPSKVRRKGLPCPGARGETLRSTASGYGPLAWRTRRGTVSRCASWPME